MGQKTGIEWANATWNPWVGCRKVSAGCKNCYMFRDQKRFGKDPTIVFRSKTLFDAPLKWARSGLVEPGARIFTCSWSDWFIEQADEWRREAWSIIRATPEYTYLILTKRIERVRECLPDDWDYGYLNVWLGVSAENQKEADARIPVLLSIPAQVRFVSAEPLLGPIDFAPYFWWHESDEEKGYREWPGLGWIITGGESDPLNPRPMDLTWVRMIRNQCMDHEVPFFHKQHGGKVKIYGAWGGRELDGQTWNEFPDFAVDA